MSKFKYTIDPEKTYTLNYDDENGKLEYEVTGKEIIASFRREAFLEQLYKVEINSLLEDITTENIHDDLRW